MGLAFATGLGSWVGMGEVASLGVPLWLAIGGLVVGVIGWRVGWGPCLYVAVGVVAVCLAQRSMAGLRSVPTSGPAQGEATLLTDPARSPGGSVRAEVRLDGRRLAATAHRSAAAALDDRLAGERITVRGRVLPPSSFERAMPHRHLTGRLEIDTVMGWRPGHAVTRAANGFRRTLERGAASMSERQRSLLSGLTLGDDRDQPADLTDAFRAAGLGHLTAASGQNVAFVLAAAAPVLMRVRFAPRLILTAGLLAGFALVTRGEPSVLRATAMAAVGAFAAATGRPTTSLRTLGVAVTGLLLCDPLLVSSLGFQLSMAGAAGIVVGAAPLQRRLPGPRWLTLPVAVTCAAQLAVAPLLIAAFGPLSLAALPANVVAVPAAGPVMVWGLTGGLVAGVVGDPLASLLHLPSRLLLWWIETVAFAAVRWPVGEVGGWHLGLLVVAGAVAGTAARCSIPVVARGLRLAGVIGALAVLAAAVAVAPGTAAPTGPVTLGPGMAVWRDHARRVALVVDGRVPEPDVPSALRRGGVQRVDLVVVRTGARQAVAAGARVREQWPRAVVVVPPSAAGLVPGAVTLQVGDALVFGDLRITASSDRLVADSAARARAPPTRWAGPPLLGFAGPGPASMSQAAGTFVVDVSSYRSTGAQGRADLVASHAVWRCPPCRPGHSGARRRRRAPAAVRTGSRGARRRGRGGRCRRRPRRGASRTAVARAGRGPGCSSRRRSRRDRRSGSRGAHRWGDAGARARRTDRRGVVGDVRRRRERRQESG
ncbi:MAG: ComEC/Rec2 family competence protein [Acidimicrobiales bacterium]